MKDYVEPDEPEAEMPEDDRSPNRLDAWIDPGRGYGRGTGARDT